MTMKILSKTLISFLLIAGLSKNSVIYAQCKQIKTVLFDLGDTLIESNGQGQFILRNDASELIELLTLQVIPIGIITNVPSDWDRTDLEALLVDPSFLDDFEVVILSSQAPADKPDPAIYNFAYSQLENPVPINQIAFVTETLAHIGNSITNPTLGARSTGMIGIHLSNLPQSLYTDFSVPTNDLLPIDNFVNSIVYCNGFE